MEYFDALDKLLTNKLAGGEACYSTSAHGDDHALACCSLATEASSALDAVKTCMIGQKQDRYAYGLIGSGAAKSPDNEVNKNVQI